MSDIQFVRLSLTSLANWHTLGLCLSGGRYIEVFRVDASGGKGKKEKKDKEIDRNFTRELKEDEEEEDVAESGRLFIRNLPYTCTEEEITQLFSKHGRYKWKTSTHIQVHTVVPSFQRWEQLYNLYRSSVWDALPYRQSNKETERLCFRHVHDTRERRDSAGSAGRTYISGIWSPTDVWDASVHHGPALDSVVQLHFKMTFGPIDVLILTCFRAGCFICCPPHWRRKRRTLQMLVVLALRLINGKKMLKTKLLVPGICSPNNPLLLCFLFLWIYSWSLIIVVYSQLREPSLIPLIHLMLPSSSHNWNTLFLGTSAVADAIAEKYNTTKSQVLDHVSILYPALTQDGRKVNAWGTSVSMKYYPSPVWVTDLWVWRFLQLPKHFKGIYEVMGRKCTTLYYCCIFKDKNSQKRCHLEYMLASIQLIKAGPCWMTCHCFWTKVEPGLTFLLADCDLCPWSCDVAASRHANAAFPCKWKQGCLSVNACFVSSVAATCVSLGQRSSRV